MATAYISTNTEISLVNTINQSLTLFLPQAPPNGRNLFVKDAAGNCGNSSIVLRVQGSDVFEDGSLFQTLNSAYESMQYIYNSNIWYFNGGTMLNTYRVSTINALTTRAINVSSATISVSSFQISDLRTSSLGTFSAVSSLLLYNGFALGGGLRTAIPQTLNNYSFSVQSLPNLVLWLDAADTRTISFSSGSNVSQWRDKTTNLFHATPAGTVTYNSVNRSMNLTVGSGRFSGHINIQGYNTSGIALSFFAVATVRAVYTGAGNSRLIQFTDNTNIDFNSSSAIPYSMSGSGNMSINRNSQNFQLTSVLTVSQNFLTSLITNTSGNTLINVNGAISGGFFASNTTITNTNTMTRYFIGSGIQFPDSWLGSINEIIVCSVSVSVFQRQQVEGYLAWKWGLQANLPASHPFRNAPPS
jgi:hypothetical protein